MSAGMPEGTEPLVVLVDEDDRELGAMGKLEAHRTGALHRAFSVFIFNNAGEVLLQQRARGKYHSAGLWANSCCGHPLPGERVSDAAVRRVREELGYPVAVEARFAFRYRTTFANGLVENELDHVLFATSDTDPKPDATEVEAVRWLQPAALTDEMALQPAQFTVWLRECWQKVVTLRQADRELR